MINYLKLVGGLFIFWMSMFFFLRLVFIGYQLFCGYHLMFSEFCTVLYRGAYMDLAMTSYFMILPLLIFFVIKWVPFNKIIFWYTIVILLLVSILYAGDVVLYREWGFRLDKTVFRYFTEIREAANFVSISNTITIAFLFLSDMILGIWLFRKMYFSKMGKGSYLMYTCNLILIPILVIPMRGGLDIIPMNPSKVYFSNKPFPNHIALNVPWNVMYSVLQSNKDIDRVQFMDDSSAYTQVKKLVEDKNLQCDTILNTRKPKVLFLVLESFTAKLIHYQHKGITVTPRLNEWFEKGIYFDNAYGSGDRTEIGIASLFSGFPAQPQSAIVHYTKKTEQLPSVIRTMKQAGYHSTFYYGGDASFANMKSYIFNMGCDQIVDKNQFPVKSYNAKWGVHDHILFERLFDEINSDSSRFLKICLSLSSHPPYDVPEPATWNSNDEETMFLNSVHYTDKHLGILLDKLSKLPVWDELLVIISADHGARFPGNDFYHVPQKFKIPVWIGGGTITRHFKVNEVFSQLDISATVLNQLGLPNDDFIFSKNVFSKSYKPFAYYAFNKGFGWVDDGGIQVYSLDNKDIILKQGNPSMDIQTGKAFLQVVLKEFDKR